MALQDDLAAAIDKDLPNQIGSRLKARLEEADLTETLNKELEQSVSRLEEENRTLRANETKELRLAEREAAVEDKERELDLREYKVGVREEFADKGRADMHMMMATVFKCPEARQYAFSLYGNANGVTNAQGYTDNPSVSLSGDITDKEAP